MADAMDASMFLTKFKQAMEQVCVVGERLITELFVKVMALNI
jgi:hypothetical protein